MIPSTMKAAELQAYGQGLVITERAVPTPKRNQVLVKIAAAPVNPSDVHSLEDPAIGGKLPVIPGREGSGVVVDAGPGFLAQRLKGRRVACASAYGRDGTWAEYLLTGANSCMLLQKQIDMETGATLIVNPITAWALIDTAKQRRHKAIANTAAASQLGRMIMKLGQAAGLQVVNIVRRPEQVDLLKGMGAAYVLNSSEPQFQAQMREMFHNLHVTLALDAISGDMTGQLLEALPNHSEVLVYGRLSGRYSHVSAVELMSTDKIVSGFLLTRWFAKQNLLKILRVSNQVQKRLGSDLKTEIQRRVTLDELPAAIAAYEENMTAGKVLLTF